MQTNPTEMYKSVYEKGTGIESPLFYSSWADAYVKGENFKKADEIFNLGLTKVKVKSELEYSYKLVYHYWNTIFFRHLFNY